MAQGPRGGWVRAAFAGLGIVVCTGAIGCMNTDKDKLPPKIGANATGKQPGPGLPGTPTLPGSPGTGLGTAKGAEPGYNSANPYWANGAQPAGGAFGSGAGAMPAGGRGYNTAGTGTGFGASSGVVGAGGLVPSAAPGGAATTGAEFGGVSGTGSAGTYGNNYTTPAATNLGVPAGPIPPARPDANGYGGEQITPPVPPSAGRYGN